MAHKVTQKLASIFPHNDVVKTRAFRLIQNAFNNSIAIEIFQHVIFITSLSGSCSIGEQVAT